MDYNGQGAGFASQPGEVVNYVENHDNQTLFDVNTLKLPLATSREDRARVQMLGAALVAKTDTAFEIVKVGFEQFVATTAQQHGFVYGLITAFMALMTGWMASIVFRKD